MIHWSKKPKKTKITKRKLLKGLKGSISILLCITLTPIMTIAASLVEYARYQEVVAVADELMEVSCISTLSDYDTYIHNRFGLLSTSQEQTLGEDTVGYLEENAKSLGKQLSVANTSVNGQLTLENVEVLRRQLVDVSELTATSAILMEDFKLQELLDKLNGVEQFQSVMNTVSGLADLTDALSNAVTKLKELKAAIEAVVTALNNVKNTATTLASQMSSLYTTLSTNGISFPEELTAEELEEKLQELYDTYWTSINNVYNTGNTLVTQITSLKTLLGNVGTSATNFVTAVEEAKTAAQNITKENEADEDGSVAEVATQSLEDILDSMAELVNNTVDSISGDAIEVAKQTLDNVVNTALESTGMSDIVDFVNGGMPTKEDWISLAGTAATVYYEGGQSGLLSYLKEKFVPDINFDFAAMSTEIGNVIDEALNGLKEDAGDKTGDLLANLINIIKGLFDMNFFFDEELNAFVSIAGVENSPYQEFIAALGTALTAVEDFSTSIDGFDLFGILDSMGDMFGAIGDLMTSIWNIAGASATSILELAQNAVTGDVQGLYEKMLIAGYMRHNFPCRLDAGNVSYDADGNVMNLDLNGTGLTGFSYNDIPRPALISGQTANVANGFQSLSTLINNLQAGTGSDSMFRGAELEYIRAGTNSELANQIFVFFDLYFLRLILDLPSIFMDTEVGTIAAAATVASWVVYILYVVLEPFCDTLLLVNGAEVALGRTNCWLTPTGIGGFVGKLAECVLGDPDLVKDLFGEDLAKQFEDFTGGSNGGTTGNFGETGYRSYVLILLLVFVDSNTMVSRFGELVELESIAYYSQQGSSFAMSKTYTAVELQADITFKPFFDLGADGGAPWLPTSTMKQSVSY